MKRTFFAVAAVVLAVSFLTTPSIAQNAQGKGKEGPGRPQTMDLASALKMAAAVVAAASAANEHVAICVMDTNGDVVLAERMDMVSDRIPISTSQGKARAVLLLGMPTGQIADAIRDHKPVSATLTPSPVGGGGEIILMRGGLPVMKDGKLIGAIGVGGSSSENDEKYAQMGIDALKAR